MVSYELAWLGSIFGHPLMQVSICNLARVGLSWEYRDARALLDHPISCKGCEMSSWEWLEYFIFHKQIVYCFPVSRKPSPWHYNICFNWYVSHLPLSLVSCMAFSRVSVCSKQDQRFQVICEVHWRFCCSSSFTLSYTTVRVVSCSVTRCFLTKLVPHAVSKHFLSWFITFEIDILCGAVIVVENVLRIVRKKVPELA